MTAIILLVIYLLVDDIFSGTIRHITALAVRTTCSVIIELDLEFVLNFWFNVTIFRGLK